MPGALIVWWPASFWLQWTLCMMAVLQSSQPNPQSYKKKKKKMYAIKQIKICAENRDMLPRPRLDLSSTPWLRPIGLSPGSWQTAHILICITTTTHGAGITGSITTNKGCTPLLMTYFTKKNHNIWDHGEARCRLDGSTPLVTSLIRSSGGSQNVSIKVCDWLILIMMLFVSL